MSKSDLRLLILLFCICGPSFADISKTQNEETGLIGWKLKQESMELELVQRLPDQTRAFFLARGFPAGIADDLGRSCIFQTILRNTGVDAGTSPTLTVSLKDWQLSHDGTSRPLKLKEVWDQEWSGTLVSKSARLAFRWATFPSIQTFQPGDYNWGMISFDLAPGMRFDLLLVWNEGDKKHSARIENLICAPDH